VSWWCRFAALFLIVAAVVCPQPASAATGVQLETRVGGIELVVHALVGRSSARSPEKHLGSSPAYDEIAPGYSLAAEGLEPLAARAGSASSGSLLTLTGALDADASFLLDEGNPLRLRGYTNALVARSDLHAQWAQSRKSTEHK
jgi:hypothetical protein